MAKNARGSRAGARTRAQSKVSTDNRKYEDPATFPDEYASMLASDHLGPDYPKGCYLIVDKRLPCESGDLVVIYPTPEAAKRGGTQPLVTHLRTVLSPGWKLPVRMGQGSEVSPVLLTSHAKDAPKCRVLNVEMMQAMYRVARIASPEELEM
ncbi:hypothetical protein [Bradyrhizobium lablabi]|uniref:hypothetical protein n=1 Tax=Bradyrhizobium lablabi TaxID=722472 RepID=UPI00090B68D2|nr:hypothetical protein [Bradyrhizobium lablabi]SHM37568.1 hypothetical protein SAMN05444321_6143 [Bradyrhizobium lablabi]